jgi:hypothetical protein
MCMFLGRCLYFFFWPLHYLSFFDLQVLITPLVSSNSSCGAETIVFVCLFLFFIYKEVDTVVFSTTVPFSLVIRSIRKQELVWKIRYNYFNKRINHFPITVTDLHVLAAISGLLFFYIMMDYLDINTVLLYWNRQHCFIYYHVLVLMKRFCSVILTIIVFKINLKGILDGG